MKLSIGIVGLPNVGKSLLFKILTKQEVNVGNYPFCTINPNVGVVADKDERLEQVAKVMNSKQILPAVFEFVDIAGLVKGSHQGAGLGNQFLAQIREVDAIIHLVRVFKDSEIVHFEGRVEPLTDFETIENELKMKDEEAKEKENLLSLKPQLVLLNGEPSETPTDLLPAIKEKRFPYLTLNLKNGLIKEDLQNIFKAFFVLLDLITFYTANENEARSWFVKKGTLAPQAAGVIHTDFEQKFIKAEVINWEKLLAASKEASLAPKGREAGSWTNARQKGWLKTEGKDYIVQDGDVIEIRHAP